MGDQVFKMEINDNYIGPSNENANPKDNKIAIGSQIHIDQEYFEHTGNTVEDTESVIEGKIQEDLAHRSVYILSMIGYIVGFGSTVKFPYLIFKYGGKFFLPYTLCYFGFGLPLFLLEVYFGQFTSRSCIQCWGTSRFLKSLGIGMVAMTVGTMFTYVMYIVWALKYLCMSFKAPLPWSSEIINSTDPNLNSQQYLEKYGFYTAEFKGPGDIGIPKLDISLCSLAIWTLLLLSHHFGIKLRFKVVYITTVPPLVILIILMFHALTLPGSSDGIYKYLSRGRYDDFNMWTYAATQIVYMLSIAEGGISCLSSFYNIKGNLIVNSLIISLTNYFTSVISTFFMCAYFGYLDTKNFNMTILEETQNLGIGYIIFPQVAALNVNSNLWSLLYYTMLVLIGFDTALAFIRIFYLAIFELFGWDHISVLIVICTFGFLVTIPLTTPGGLYLFHIFDDFSSSWSKLLVACLISILTLVIYNGMEISKDIEFMLSDSKVTMKLWRYVKWYFVTCWYGICQVLLMIFLIGKLYYLGAGNFQLFINNNFYQYTRVELAFSWLIGVCCPLSVIIALVVYCILSRGSVTQRSKYILNSETDKKPWFPATEKDRLDLKKFKENL